MTKLRKLNIDVLQNQQEVYSFIKISCTFKENRELAFAWYVRGRLLMDAGDEPRAQRSFRRAVRLTPDDVESARWLRLLTQRLDG